MKLQELLKEEHKEGRKEGRAEMVFDLINDKTITLEKGAEKLGITPQELKKQMDGRAQHPSLFLDHQVFNKEGFLQSWYSC